MRIRVWQAGAVCLLLKSVDRTSSSCAVACSSSRVPTSTPEEGTSSVLQTLKDAGVVRRFARRSVGTSVRNFSAMPRRLSPGLCGGTERDRFKCQSIARRWMLSFAMRSTGFALKELMRRRSPLCRRPTGDQPQAQACQAREWLRHLCLLRILCCRSRQRRQNSLPVHRPPELSQAAASRLQSPDPGGWAAPPPPIHRLHGRMTGSSHCSTHDVTPTTWKGHWRSKRPSKK